MTKKQDPERPDDQDAPPPISFVFTDDESDVEKDGLDAAVIRSLTQLSQATGHEFVHYQRPPTSLLKWLEKATLSEVDGLLILTLRRWHELQGRLQDDRPQ